jgi:FMN-dependent NADH-azoreductase
VRLLHVIATPRGAGSTTLRVSKPLLEHLQATRPDLQIETLELFTQGLPTIAGQNIDTKYGLMKGQPIDAASAQSWRNVEDLIHQFLRADVCVISSPMWNFSIPYTLKYYIDAIVQPGYLFAYDEAGIPMGLCQGKRMVCVTSRGGDYSDVSPMHSYDQQEPYLRAIFGFAGITDIDFINVQPADLSPLQTEEAVSAGIAAARQLADKLAEVQPSPVAAGHTSPAATRAEAAAGDGAARS